MRWRNCQNTITFTKCRTAIDTSNVPSFLARISKAASPEAAGRGRTGLHQEEGIPQVRHGEAGEQQTIDGIGQLHILGEDVVQEEGAVAKQRPGEIWVRWVAMDALEAIATTRAIRRYVPGPIPDEDLAQILFAASRAPSGSNRQAWRMVVMRDGPNATQAKALLGTAFRANWNEKRASDGYGRGSGAEADTPKARTALAMQHFVDHFEETPVVILACLERYRDPNPYEGNSVYPAVQNLLLAARVLGYGGVITGWHAGVETELRTILEIPDGVAIHATIPLGRPMGSHGPVRRRPLGELVFEDGWGQSAVWAVDPPGTRHAQAGPPRGSSTSLPRYA